MDSNNIYGIGKLVPYPKIKIMSNYINENGEKAFIDAVYHGAFSNVAFAYIHPAEEMRQTLNFDVIHKAFKNAYT